MTSLTKRVFSRIFRSLISVYGPTALTIAFAVIQGLFFPNSPIWLIPLFFIFVMVGLSIYEIVKFKRKQ
ncbi:hypothetical protein GC090_20745 (plasmid) [Pantoea sp. JZ29]|nr:hypothetical protein [Pantoea sp. JZ29]WRH23087.1 hypothetical protein GC090_20745 [Pantoea sp. JZ29]